MAFALAYERIMRHRDEAERLEVDAVLDMPGARAERDRQRMASVGEFGIEVG